MVPAQPAAQPALTLLSDTLDEHHGLEEGEREWRAEERPDGGAVESKKSSAGKMQHRHGNPSYTLVLSASDWGGSLTRGQVVRWVPDSAEGPAAGPYRCGGRGGAGR